MKKFSHKTLKKYIIPSFILGAILLFTLISPSFADASIIVTDTYTEDPDEGWGIIVTDTYTEDPNEGWGIIVTDTNVPDTTTNSPCPTCTASTPTISYHPPCHYPNCHYPTTTTTTHPECHYPPCTTTTTQPPCTTTTTTICHSPSANISADPISVPYNGSAVLRWTSYNTKYCTASASPYNYQWGSGISLNGSKTIYNLAQTTTFSITCTGSCGTATDSATVYIQSAQQFDFSLSNSGNIVVTKPISGNITGSNIITANLVSGASKSASFSQSGLPYGVSASYLGSCYPTCSKSNTLTINSSAQVGTFPITVTATGGGITRTTTYSLIIQDSYTDTLSVSCYVSPNPAQTNQTVTFSSNVSGGSGNYSYYWSGATYGNNSYSQKTFSSYGDYTAYLTVHDSQNRSASTSCSVNVNEQYTNAPTLNLWADKYTIAQGESTYLRWTSTNTNYCTASNGWSGNKSTSGYESVSPNSDTTYSLTCYGDGGQITRSITIYVTSVSTNLNLTKLGRNLSSGDRVYSKVIRVTEGDVIEFYLTVTAGSNKDLHNVSIKDIMPSVLSYMPGTTKIDGIVQSDTITTTGLSLGTIYKGNSKTIVFQAISLYPGTYLTYTNTAEVLADNETKITDSASITYGLVAGAATIRTGPLNTLLISLVISLISSLMIWYYLKFNPKGQLAFVKTESKIRDIWLGYTRRRIMRGN